jgi:hypothetical protein
MNHFSEPLAKAKYYFLTILGALVIAVGVAAAPAAAPAVGASSPTYVNGFESDTAGWIDYGGSVVERVASPSASSGYANTVNAASGSYLARLQKSSHCYSIPSGGGPVNQCDGPFTRWGGYNGGSTTGVALPAGGYTTQLDIYLDANWAKANPDTRFDFTSNVRYADGTPNYKEFVFNVGTDSTNGFVIAASNNANRSGANPFLAANRQNISESGWYTFRHNFHKDSTNTYLIVDMDISHKGGSSVAQWTLPSTQDTNVGCNYHGWFANQEIPDLPIDNAQMTGCGTPLPPSTPVANDVSYDTNEDQTLSMPAPGVLSNATDPNIPANMTAVKVTEPTKGTLTLSPDGSFTYIPNSGFSGSDTFTYKATHGSAESSPATVTITVNKTPVPTPPPGPQPNPPPPGAQSNPPPPGAQSNPLPSSPHKHKHPGHHGGHHHKHKGGSHGGGGGEVEINQGGGSIQIG